MVPVVINIKPKDYSIVNYIDYRMKLGTNKGKKG